MSRKAAPRPRVSAQPVGDGVPEAARPVLWALEELGKDATVVEVGQALSLLADGRPSRQEWVLTRELLLSAVRGISAVSSPARLVDQYLAAPGNVTRIQPRRTEEGGPEREEGEWPAWPDEVPLARNRMGEIRATLGNALLYVRFFPQIRGRLSYSERWLRCEWSTPPPWPRPGRGPAVTDDDAVELAAWISERDGVGFGKDAIHSAMDAEARQHPSDEVRSYLEGLKWDGVERTLGWLAVYLGAEPDEWLCEAGRSWLVSAVARAMDPGCQCDYMIVLEGAQGTRKSSALRTLAGEDYFADLAMDPGSQGTIEAIHGPWIIEWSELSGLSRREAESVKGFLTRRTDRFRPAYGRKTQDLHRRCIFAGSTNEKTYLSDPTGARRYWPVRCGEIDIEALERDRDQLWAEAVTLYESGAQRWLSAECEAAVAVEQDSRQIQDTWDDKIQAWIDARPPSVDGDDDYISTTEVLGQALDLPSSAQTTGTSRRLSASMGRLGWKSVRRRVDGVRQRGYQRVGGEARQISAFDDGTEGGVDGGAGGGFEEDLGDDVSF